MADKETETKAMPAVQANGHGRVVEGGGGRWRAVEGGGGLWMVEGRLRTRIGCC